MTVSVDGNDITQIVQVAASVFSILLMIVCGWFVYLMVRPSRRARDKARDADPGEAEQLWRVVDVMERRLEVLERALADKIERPRLGADRDRGIFAPAEDGRESGRTE